jgi:hypothetical protein
MKQLKKRTKMLRSYITEEEYTIIVENSQRSGLTLSSFIRRMCLGMNVPSREDAQARRELCKINGDLGRLGGLLKIAITDENRAAIRPLLKEIEKKMKLLREKILEVQ